MPQFFCSPEQLKDLADLLTRGKVGEVKVSVEGLNPSKTDSGVEAEIRRKFGFGGFFRTQRGAFGPEGSARIITPLILIANKLETFRSNAFKSFIDGLEPLGIKGPKRILGISAKDDKELFDTILKFDSSGKYVGPEAMSRTSIMESARNIWQTMNKMGEDNKIRLSKYLEYREAIHANGDKGPLLYEDTPFYRQFREGLTPEETKFFFELERRGVPRRWTAKMSSMFQDYTGAIGSKRILTPAIDKLEKDEVIPFFGAKFYKKADGSLGKYADDAAGWQMWHDLKMHVYGQPTDMDRKITYALQQLGDMFQSNRVTGALWNKVAGEAPLATENVYAIGQAISNLFFGGVLSTPGAVVRQVFQLNHTVAELGVKPTVMGIQKLFDKVYIDKLIADGILNSPLEAIYQQVGLARNAGRIIHQTTHTALKLFSAADQAMRVITAGGADHAFNEALERGITSLRAGREIKDQIVKLVNQNQIKQARDLYLIDVVSNTQFSYGRVNRSDIMRGALGQAIGMLQSYPMNLAEMYIMFGKRALQAATGQAPKSEALPLIRQLGLVTGLILAGKEGFGTDLTSNFLSFPGIPPLAQTTGAFYSAGRTNVEWLWGKAFQLGETDYHKRLRTEADREFARQASNFIPGGLAYRQYLKVADQPTFTQVMRLLGFPPMSEEINLEVRAKASQRRREKKFEETVNP